MNAMSFTNRFKIIGAYPDINSFEDDNGKTVSYDRNILFVEMPLAKGKGFNGVKHKFGLSADFDRIFHCDLPAIADVTFEQTTAGNGKVTTNIVGIDFVKSQAQPQGAK